MGLVKEMQRWAYEIHSSFLVPGAPLAVPNIEQSIVDEIDKYAAVHKLCNMIRGGKGLVLALWHGTKIKQNCHFIITEEGGGGRKLWVKFALGAIPESAGIGN